MRTLAIVSILVILSSLPVRAQQAQLYDDRPKINVVGEAVVYVKPDKIVISFGIQTLDKDIQQAKKLNNDVLAKAVAAIKECGVPEKEVQTDYLSIEPRYDDRYGAPQHFLGYFVQDTFTATLGDPAKVDELVSSVLAAGVTNIHGIDFQTTEFKKYREQARELALQSGEGKSGENGRRARTIDRHPAPNQRKLLGHAGRLLFKLVGRLGIGSKRRDVAKRGPRHARQFRRRFRHDRPRQALDSCRRQRDI